MSVESWKSFFEIGGVVLLFLTFAFGAGFFLTGKVVNQRQEERLRQFDKDLTTAKTELGKQQERAAKAEGDAAEAKSAAAKAEKELLELHQKLADRSLSDEQFKEIAERLKPFAGQEYEVIAYWESKESVGIAERINQALQSAHWKFLPLSAWHGMLGGVVGVLVWSHPDADEKTKGAVKSLISVLRKEGIQADERTQNPVNNPKHNKISLNVGSKR